MIAREPFETVDRVTVPALPSVSLVTRRAALRGLGGAGLALGGLAVLGRAAQAGEGLGGDAGPAGVLARYVAAVNAGDLDRILACYAEDAVHLALPTADGAAGVCRGTAAVTVWYERALEDGIRIELVPGSVAVDGARAAFALRTSTASWTAVGLGPLAATAEIAVGGGLIRTHVVLLTPEAVRQLLAAQGVVPGAHETAPLGPARATRR